MTLDRYPHLPTLKRYQMMFKTSIGSAVIGVVLTLAGLFAWIGGPMPQFLPWSMMMISMGGLLGYKVVLSTSKILEANGEFSRR
jgi:hypothetical protein